MNEVFKSYTRSVAFRLSLSHVQAQHLLALEENIPLYYKKFTIQSLQVLKNKGLVNHDTCPGPWIVTKEGKLVIELLKSSGIVLEWKYDRELEDA